MSPRRRRATPTSGRDNIAGTERWRPASRAALGGDRASGEPAGADPRNSPPAAQDASRWLSPREAEPSSETIRWEYGNAMVSLPQAIGADEVSSPSERPVAP